MALTKIFRQEEELVLRPSLGTAPDMAWVKDEYEGQLSVDVYQTEDSLIVRSTIAGVRPEDLEITLNDDVVTIRGRRMAEMEVPKEDYFYQECYWGAFSRSIVLPVEVKAQEAKASLRDGVLTLMLPKSSRSNAAVEVKVEAQES